MHRQLRLHPNCKRQQHAHLVETEAQVQTVRFWRLDDLQDRLYLNDLDDMGKSIVLPKIQNSTYRLLLKLVKDGILETAMTSRGSKVIYPDWTETWTWPGWDGDVSREAGEAALARERQRKKGRGGGRRQARNRGRGRGRRRETSPGDLGDSFESLGTEETSLAVAEDHRMAAVLDFYKLKSGRASAYTSSIRRLARLDSKVQQCKAGISDRTSDIYKQLYQMIVAK